jgi:DNA-binding HxlR family transcriptional regulator
MPGTQNHTESSCVLRPEELKKRCEETRRALALFNGKWRLEILWLLSQRVHRFNELRRSIPGVTQHMLTRQLRELEAGGLIRRTVYAEVPARVEYEITSEALRLRPVMEGFLEWTARRAREAER